MQYPQPQQPFVIQNQGIPQYGAPYPRQPVVVVQTKTAMPVQSAQILPYQNPPTVILQNQPPMQQPIYAQNLQNQSMQMNLQNQQFSPNKVAGAFSSRASQDFNLDLFHIKLTVATNLVEN